MKKSGSRAPWPACAQSGSADIAISPQAEQVAVEILAQRRHLVTEALAQLDHIGLVEGRRLGEDDVALGRVEGAAAQPRRRERLDRALQRSRHGPRPTDTARSSSCMRSERTCTLGLASLGSISTASSTPRKRSTTRTLASLSALKSS